MSHNESSARPTEEWKQTPEQNRLHKQAYIAISPYNSSKYVSEVVYLNRPLFPEKKAEAGCLFVPQCITVNYFPKQ